MTTTGARRPQDTPLPYRATLVGRTGVSRRRTRRGKTSPTPTVVNHRRSSLVQPAARISAARVSTMKRCPSCASAVDQSASRSPLGHAPDLPIHATTRDARIAQNARPTTRAARTTSASLMCRAVSHSQRSRALTGGCCEPSSRGWPPTNATPCRSTHRRPPRPHRRSSLHGGPVRTSGLAAGAGAERYRESARALLGVRAGSAPPSLKEARVTNVDGINT